MTTVINLAGAAGAGKSTLAAGLFHKLKSNGFSAELVNEYVKSWAYRGIMPGPLDEIYFFGKQSHKESILFGKVDFIITDCPIYLCSFYEQVYNPESFQLVKDLPMQYMRIVQQLYGVTYHNYFIHRVSEVDQRGRYSDTKDSDEKSALLQIFMEKHGIAYTSHLATDIDTIYANITRNTAPNTSP